MTVTIRLLFFFLVLGYTISSGYAYAQQNQPVSEKKTGKLQYTYTFSGLQSQAQAQDLEKELKSKTGVLDCKILFKSAQHKYAQLIVDVKKPAYETEKFLTIEEIKYLLLEKGYTPGESNEKAIN